MGMNLEIRKLNDSLCETLNQSTLPIEVKRLVVDKILNVLTDASNEMVKQEIDEIISNEKEKENEHQLQQS